MYARALSGLASGGIGAQPAAAGARHSSIGVPPAKPHIEAAPYDAAQDPGWKGILDPNDHELRNFLNQIEPEQRQMLLQRVMQAASAMKPGNGPPGVPPIPQQMPMGAPAAPSVSPQPPLA